MSGELRVDPHIVAAGGQALADLAGGLPPAPAAFTAVPGADPLSAAALTRQHTSEVPVLEGLPVIKVDSAATAGKVAQAATMYADADARWSQRLNAVLADDPAGGSSASGGGSPAGTGTGSGLSSATAGGATAAADARGGAPGSSAATAAGAAGSAMSMPMQMASQAAQIPAQLGGALASAPQGLAGVASSGVGQVAGAAGKVGATQPGQSDPGAVSGATAGQDGERAPVDDAPRSPDSRGREH